MPQTPGASGPMTLERREEKQVGVQQA